MTGWKKWKCWANNQLVLVQQLLVLATKCFNIGLHQVTQVIYNENVTSPGKTSESDKWLHWITCKDHKQTSFVWLTGVHLLLSYQGLGISSAIMWSFVQIPDPVWFELMAVICNLLTTYHRVNFHDVIEREGGRRREREREGEGGRERETDSKKNIKSDVTDLSYNIAPCNFGL